MKFDFDEIADQIARAIYDRPLSALGEDEAARCRRAACLALPACMAQLVAATTAAKNDYAKDLRRPR